MFHLFIIFFQNYKCLLENIHLNIKNYKKIKKKMKEEGKTRKTNLISKGIYR